MQSTSALFKYGHQNALTVMRKGEKNSYLCARMSTFFFLWSVCTSGSACGDQWAASSVTPWCTHPPCLGDRVSLIWSSLIRLGWPLYPHHFCSGVTSVHLYVCFMMFVCFGVCAQGVYLFLFLFLINSRIKLRCLWFQICILLTAPSVQACMSAFMLFLGC